MRIQFASDLHLELSDNSRYLKEHPLPVVGDVLLLAGDIIYLEQENLIRHPFWQWAADHFKQVIAIPGNHEFYAFYDIASLPESCCWELFPNVKIYSNAVVRIGNADIITSTMWAHIDIKDAYSTERYVSDFRRIRYGDNLLTAADFNREHAKCLNFVKQAVANSTMRTKIVLSHHVPTGLCTAPEFSGSNINGAFTVELGNYIADSDIDYWIYGHSHRNIDARIGRTRILSNQLGYIAHNEHIANGFKPERIIEL